MYVANTATSFAALHAAMSIAVFATSIAVPATLFQIADSSHCIAAWQRSLQCWRRPLQSLLPMLIAQLTTSIVELPIFITALAACLSSALATSIIPALAASKMYLATSMCNDALDSARAVILATSSAIGVAIASMNLTSPCSAAKDIAHIAMNVASAAIDVTRTDVDIAIAAAMDIASAAMNVASAAMDVAPGRHLHVRQLTPATLQWTPPCSTAINVASQFCYRSYQPVHAVYHYEHRKTPPML
jgi:hypothetical protein